MAVQRFQLRTNGFAVEASQPIDWLWTWSGVFFGYRYGEWLFTYEGIAVGRFVRDEVYDANGNYLGELRSTGQELRLTSSNYKTSQCMSAFAPKAEKAYEKLANRPPQTVYCGYQDFPSPEGFKKEVQKTLHSRTEIVSRFNARRVGAPRRHGRATTLAQQTLQTENVVSVDANVLARLIRTEPNKGIGDIDNVANSVRQSIISNVQSEQESSLARSEERAEILRQVLSNIKSRHAKA